ncbi:Lysine--tRNA ligase [Podosphaera aphanis]|nr:Lysine--tRNA ligase [Podosphaera aphanis]
MNSFSFLHPYLHTTKPLNQSAYYTFKKSIFRRSLAPAVSNIRRRYSQVSQEADVFEDASPVILKRARLLESSHALSWPRIKKHSNSVTIPEFRIKWNSLGLQADSHECVCVMGKLMRCRVMGTRLIFMDLMQDGQVLQVMANLSNLVEKANVSEKSFHRLCHLARRGDYIAVFGHAHRTKTGELSIMADELPEIVCPSLAQLPRNLQDPETRMRNRHVDLLLNPKLQQTLRMRSIVTQFIRNFLLEDEFVEVQTPLITDKASGAVAKPFNTTSAVISNRQLALRIAPELWLKRLIIGGLDRIFEMGPVFRNEGFDTTHNPEFTTCEFYKAFADLEELFKMTENLFVGLIKAADHAQKERLVNLPEIDTALYKTPFRRLNFIPTLEEALGETLPDLAEPTATEKVIALLARHNIPPIKSPTLPRLLDKLSSIYIEPSCSVPTFIMHHPVCLAPLAKSFEDPSCKQVVSARAELFINGIELANMYEEENSPIAQRAKFEEQALYADGENEGIVDESYLSALEWGLPPTGGWGCGIDRLVMLLTSSERISDVLSFGTLKNVVSVAANDKKTNG